MAIPKESRELYPVSLRDNGSPVTDPTGIEFATIPVAERPEESDWSDAVEDAGQICVQLEPVEYGGEYQVWVRLTDQDPQEPWAILGTLERN